jgi:uncharacterized RmlC-like cupin family protein
MNSRSVDECYLINLPKISNPEGNLTFIEGSNQIPFDIQRVYYLYDVPGGAIRGSHAHKNLHQIIISASGSFDIELDDGRKKKRFHLNRPFEALYIPPMMWRLLDNFSSGACCLVLASEKYSELDYIRNYKDFAAAAK